ncbi:MAG: TrmH family RNA methyltransferase [Mycobacteriales bacterium]|nr:MAG: RNA methyltransferase [Pseudonocardiales bacterium]
MSERRSPRDAFLTVYGRQPVAEALADERLRVAHIIVADGAHGENLDAILAAARRRGTEIRHRSAQQVKLIAGNGRHDQGVAADVVAPRMRQLEEFLGDWERRERDDAPLAVLVLDGVTNPANVGMILRTATAAGFEGIVVPRAGTAAVGPLVIKASAGVAFRAPILRCHTAAGALSALTEAGIVVYGLAGDAGDRLDRAELSPVAAYVVGNESTGVDPELHPYISQWLSIPLHGGVESLNVASATAILAYEVERRRS